MPEDDLQRRLRAAFLGELDETVVQLESSVRELAPRAHVESRHPAYELALRAAHRLKGAARSIGMIQIENACHLVEDLLIPAREADRPLSSGELAVLHELVDALRTIAHTGELENPALDAVTVRLTAVARGAVDPALPPVGGDSPPVVAAIGPVLRIEAVQIDALVARLSDVVVARTQLSERARDAAAILESVRHARKIASERPVLARAQGHDASTVGLLRDAHDQLRRHERDLDQLVTGLTADLRNHEVAVLPVERDLRRLRLVPVAEACEGLPRMTRELALELGVRAELHTAGLDLAVDRSVVDALRAVFVQLVRNALAHGIERPSDRLAAGKPEEATIAIEARLRGSAAEITVRDDGRGIDRSALRAALRARGANVPDDQLLASVFLPGLSTSRRVDDVSGRGIGLDIVARRVEQVHGRIEVDSVEGAGTTFAITVPITLGGARALVVGASGFRYAVLLSSVSRVVRVPIDRVTRVGGRDLFAVEGVALPIVWLAALIGTPTVVDAAMRPAVIVHAAERRVVLLVDEVVSEQEIVMRPLGPRFRRVRPYAGLTILADGKFTPILHAADIVVAASTAGRSTVSVARKPRVRRKILLAEDSATTRTLEQSILEAAGYEVVPASHGAEAWRLIQQRAFDAVIADIEMPEMDGFALCESIRAVPQLRDLPVVLVTGRSSDADRARGLAAGANAYIAKSGFDQQGLLDLLGDLLEVPS